MSVSLPLVSSTHVVDLSRMTRDELIDIARKQAKQIRDKNTRIDSMESLIDSLTSALPSTPHSEQPDGTHHREADHQNDTVGEQKSLRSDACNLTSSNSIVPTDPHESHTSPQSQEELIVSLQKAVTERNQIIAAKENELRQLSAKVGNWKSRVLEIITKDEKRITELTDRLEQTRSEYDKLLTQTKQYHTQPSCAHPNIEQTTAEMNTKAEHNDGTRNVQQGADEEMTALKKRVMEIQDALHAAKKDCEVAAEHAIEEKNNVVQEYEQKIETMRERVETWKQKAKEVLSCTESECTDLRNTVTSLTEENKKLSGELTDLKKYHQIDQTDADSFFSKIISKVQLTEDGNVTPEHIAQLLREVTDTYQSQLKTLTYELYRAHSTCNELLTKKKQNDAPA